MFDPSSRFEMSTFCQQWHTLLNLLKLTYISLRREHPNLSHTQTSSGYGCSRRNRARSPIRQPRSLQGWIHNSVELSSAVLEKDLSLSLLFRETHLRSQSPKYPFLFRYPTLAWYLFGGGLSRVVPVAQGCKDDGCVNERLHVFSSSELLALCPSCRSVCHHSVPYFVC